MRGLDHDDLPMLAHPRAARCWRADRRRSARYSRSGCRRPVDVFEEAHFDPTDTTAPASAVRPVPDKGVGGGERRTTRRRGRRLKVAGDSLQGVAIRSAVMFRLAFPDASTRPFVADFTGLRRRFGGWREPLFSWVFLTFSEFLTAQPYRALAALASALNERRGHVAIGPAAAIVRANLPGPAKRPGT